MQGRKVGRRFRMNEKACLWWLTTAVETSLLRLLDADDWSWPSCILSESTGSNEVCYQFCHPDHGSNLLWVMTLLTLLHCCCWCIWSVWSSATFNHILSFYLYSLLLLLLFFFQYSYSQMVSIWQQKQLIWWGLCSCCSSITWGWRVCTVASGWICWIICSGLKYLPHKKKCTIKASS